MAISKVICHGETLIDLTMLSVTAEKILVGYTAKGADGELITGTCDFDVNSQDATVKVAEVLEGATFYARGEKHIGTMPNKGGNSIVISDTNEVTIPLGFYDGSGKVKIADAEKLKLIASNIKQGIKILGVEGNLEPSSAVTVHAKTVTPGKEAKIVIPDEGYDYLSQVTVEPIPYTETENAAGGITVTIGG